MTQIATDVENVLPLYKISDGKGGGDHGLLWSELSSAPGTT